MLKKIINFSLNNKLAIWILSIIVIFMGIYSGLNMKQEAIPDITLPNLSVVTTYPGAAPDVVAKDVTEPIEQRVQNLNGVELFMSSSYANASSVMIQFDYGTDMDKATTEVQEALENLSLPDSASDPDVMRISFNAMPVMAASISDSDRSLEELTELIEKEVLPSLEGIDGLAEAQMAGQQIQEVSITFDQKALAEHGLTEDTVEQLIQGSSVTFPLGLTTFDKSEKNVVIDNDIVSLEDLKNVQIPYTPQMPELPDGAMNPGMGNQGNGGDMPTEGENPAESQLPTEGDMSSDQMAQAEMGVPTVKLGDLAKIEMVKKAPSISRTNGEESIGLQIVKAPQANTVEVVNKVKDVLDDFESDFGFTATTTFDQAEPIEASVSLMVEKAIFGIVFAVIVILLFLRNFRTTVISIVSIPLSLLMAIFFLHQMDITLNILTLGALTVAIGRVIDDSIVVMENIYRRMSLPDEKLQGKELIREATRQMFIPIFSSTVVTIVVFLPIALVGGMVGELFLPFALAIVFALAASLIVAVTIVPMLSHSLFKKRLVAKTNGEQLKQEKKESKLANFYKGILEWSLNHKIIVFGSATIVLVASLFLIPVIGASFLPDEEEKMMIATYSPEPGQTRAQAEEVALEAESLLNNRDGVEMYQFSLGEDSMMGMGAMMGINENSALFFIKYEDDFKNFSEESKLLIEDLNQDTERGDWGSLDFSGMSSGLELNVFGNNVEDIQAAMDEIIPAIEKNKDLDQVESSLTEAYDQYTLVADQKKLSEQGLTAAQIGMALSDNQANEALTTVKHDGADVDVFVEVEKNSYKTIDDLTKIEIDTPLGTKVKIADVVEVKEGKSPETIERLDGKMYASVTADINSKDAAGVSSTVDKAIEKLDLPAGVKVEFGGVTEQIEEAFTQLGVAMVAAIAIVYFVLVVTFSGGLAPFAILFSLPFTVIGSLVALWIFGEPVSVSAMIGALMLIGIVVTNAIVLVDRVIRNEKTGMETRAAILEAGGTRLRPILMTALATIGALSPLLFGMEDGGGLISKGLAITVIGGLVSSTLLTLVIVPIVYEVIGRPRKKNKQLD